MLIDMVSIYSFYLVTCGYVFYILKIYSCVQFLEENISAKHILS